MAMVDASEMMKEGVLKEGLTILEVHAQVQDAY